MDDFEKLTNFIQSIFAISLSETIGISNEGMSISVDICIQALNEVIKEIPLKEINGQESEEEKISESDVEDVNIDSNWQMWMNKIYKNAENIARRLKNGSIINGYFNPEFATSFKK